MQWITRGAMDVHVRNILSTTTLRRFCSARRSSFRTFTSFLLFSQWSNVHKVHFFTPPRSLYPLRIGRIENLDAARENCRVDARPRKFRKNVRVFDWKPRKRLLRREKQRHSLFYQALGWLESHGAPWTPGENFFIFRLMTHSIKWRWVFYTGSWLENLSKSFCSRDR